MLADNRTAKVPGRIKFLIISIKTIKGIRIVGVLRGTKWVNMWLVLLIQPYSINLIQIGRANDREKVKCLEEVKIWGNKPKKLLKISK
jgi:hypothetical protein